MRSAITAVSEFKDARHLKVAIILIPTKSEVYHWLLNDDRPWTATSEPSGFSAVLRAISQDEGFHFLDLKPILIDHAKQVFEEEGKLL